MGTPAGASHPIEQRSLDGDPGGSEGANRRGGTHGECGSKRTEWIGRKTLKNGPGKRENGRFGTQTPTKSNVFVRDFKAVLLIPDALTSVYTPIGYKKRLLGFRFCTQRLAGAEKLRGGFPSGAVHPPIEVARRAQWFVVSGPWAVGHAVLSPKIIVLGMVEMICKTARHSLRCVFRGLGRTAWGGGVDKRRWSMARWRFALSR